MSADNVDSGRKTGKSNSDKSVLDGKKIEFRQYQKDIAAKCVNKNSLVVLPTGLGKTIIAVLVAAETLKTYPPNSKIIVLAPTRPLINQHYDSFLNFLTVSEEKFAVLTGKIAPEKRATLFEEKGLLFYTPQTLRNDLVSKRYSLQSVCLIVFDEAHHASGDYPYSMIADKYLEQNPDGISLALTASPGASKKKIELLCKNLHVPLTNTHFRTRKDSDVKHYLKPMDIFKIGVNLTELMEDAYSVLKYILEDRLQYLSKLGFLGVKAEVLFKKIIRKDLLKLNKELIEIIKGTGEKMGAYGALSVNAQALILYHMIELVEQQGLDSLLNNMEKTYKDALKKNSSKATKILASDRRLRQVYLELKKNFEFSPENLIHPKFLVLEKILREELRHNPSSRILVFAKFRVSVKNIVDKLKRNESIRPVRFVGQATTSKDDKGLSQKKQLEILELFKNGKYNALVSTNVGEEGLDIAECDMVVFYDVVASEIRFIQRKGRTARHREGKVVILYAKGTNDDIYMRIALSRLKKMNVSLKSSHELKNFYSAKKEDFNLKIRKEEWSTEEPIESNKMKEISTETETENNSEIENEIIINDKKSQKQSNLQSFISGKTSTNPKEISKKKAQISGDFRLSKAIPMKIGLRKKLMEGQIPFQIVDSEDHVVIFDQVLVHIYEPKPFSKAQFLEIQQHTAERYKLVIIVFDFVDYIEDFEGEKRLIKRKVQNFGTDQNIQVIAIDHYDELYFVVKSIYEHGKERSD